MWKTHECGQKLWTLMVKEMKGDEKQVKVNAVQKHSYYDGKNM